MRATLHRARCPAAHPTKASASNSPKSAACSPMPMKRIGSFMARAMATTMPPRAVPSSLVSTRPVTPTAAWNSFACASAFWPWLASSTSSTSSRRGRHPRAGSRGGSSSVHPSGATGCAAGRRCRRSPHRCRAPAPSAAHRTPPRRDPRPPACCTISAPLRSAQISSCSAAAARKVSPAASITL